MENTVMQFVIDGVPVGKGRPRVTKHGYAYTPPRTKSYEELVQWSFRSANKQRLPIGKGQPVEVTITAYYPIPTRVSKSVREMMLSGIIRPCKKPDFDNVAKIICDALNGLAYYDDAQIVDCQVKKFYSEKPRVVVSIEPMILTDLQADSASQV